MRILTLTNMYPCNKFPFYGMVVKEEVGYLQHKKLDVDVFFVNGRENRINYLKGILDLWQLLLKKKFDIIHAHHTYCAYMALISLSFLKKRIPIILTLHEGEICHNGRVHYRIDFLEKLKYVHFIKEYIISRIDYLITVYEGLLKRTAKTKYSLLPCGVNLEIFRPLPKEECRKKLGIDENMKVIFFPSDYRRPEKRFDLVQKAYTILKAYHGNNLILLYGGSIPYEAMPTYFNASDVAVLTSDYEASPMVVKEAMATCVPLISVDVGDIRRLIDGLEGCFLVTPQPYDIASKLEKALDFNKRTQGRAKIEELGLSVEQVTSKIAKIYETIISKN